MNELRQENASAACHGECVHRCVCVCVCVYVHVHVHVCTLTQQYQASSFEVWWLKCRVVLDSIRAIPNPFTKVF